MERAPVLVRHGGLVLRQLPPGFRFHPTDEELVVQYLRRKALGFPLPAAVIPEVHDLYKLDPWDIPGASEGEKYFFAVRSAAGATAGNKRGGGRCRSSTTASGCWKPAGGREKPVVASLCGGNRLVGVKKSMVFVLRGKKGKAPCVSPARQTDWVMHEYRLALPPHTNGCLARPEESEQWVVCRIFQRNRSSRRPDHDERRVPGGHTAAAHRTMMPPPSLSVSSSSSCVTSSSDQEEVSSGHKQDALETAASQRKA